MMSRILFHGVVALLAAALSACVADASVVDRHATATQAAAKAIVVVSVSHDLDRTTWRSCRNQGSRV
jgi:hypothetical protein